MEKFRKFQQKELKVNLTKQEAITLLLGQQRVLHNDDKIVEKRNVGKTGILKITKHIKNTVCRIKFNELHVLKIIRRKEKAKIKNVTKYDLPGNQNVRKVNEVLYQTKSLTKFS